MHEWVVGNMSYTLDSYYTFNWYHWIFSIGITIDILFLYSYIFLYMYAYTSNSINFDWYSIFHTYICFICTYYISISLSTNFSYAKLDFLNGYYIFNWLIFNWYLIQAYASFYLVFHKGGENLYFTFQVVLFTFRILLPHFMKNDWKRILIIVGIICF